MLNSKELKLKELPELRGLLADAKKHLDELRFKAHQGQLKSVREIRVIKKDIAKLMTAVNGKAK